MVELVWSSFSSQALMTELVWSNSGWSRLLQQFVIGRSRLTMKVALQTGRSYNPSILVKVGRPKKEVMLESNIAGPTGQLGTPDNMQKVGYTTRIKRTSLFFFFPYDLHHHWAKPLPPCRQPLAPLLSSINAPPESLPHHLHRDRESSVAIFTMLRRQPCNLHLHRNWIREICTTAQVERASIPSRIPFTSLSTGNMPIQPLLRVSPPTASGSPPSRPLVPSGSEARERLRFEEGVQSPLRAHRRPSVVPDDLRIIAYGEGKGKSFVRAFMLVPDKHLGSSRCFSVCVIYYV
ncbi:hypothetical protein LR48_Vigan05g125700 [Vigna angularis]|uniref:Uncharacterized protein n=1 Tax=Phaseolus angularis TaxID=3914 RepID=A0A0L9UM60_PHAAN|nr:hypothetical protein LR48_Vigan05g125700 [Vigna angularis]